MSRMTVSAASLLAAVAIGLSACTVPDTARTGFRQGGEANGLIALSQAGDGVEASEGILFADPIQREEYAHFPLNGGQAEIVYISTRNVYNDNVALDDWITIDSMIKSWNHVRQNGLELGEVYGIDADWIKMWVKPFELTSLQQKCAGFFASWDRPSDAPLHHPAKILMGYICQPPGQAFERDDVEASLRAIGIRGINVALGQAAADIEGLTDTIPQQDLARRAQSPSGEPSRGNPNFPYRIATIYNITEPCDLMDPC